MPLELSTVSLSLHRLIIRLAGASVVAFLWAFIFAYFRLRYAFGDALAHALLLYALSEIVALLAVPFAMRYMRGSMKRGLIMGTLALAMAYCYVGVLWEGGFSNGVPMIGVLLGLYRALYRVPYAVESGYLDVHGSFFNREVVLALMPAIAGSLLSLGLPFAHLMFIAALLALIGLALLALVVNVTDEYTWSYRETFRQFLHERNAAVVFGAMAAGARAVALVVLWPLALVALGVRSWGLLGAFVSIALLISLMYGRGGGYRAVEHQADAGLYVDEYTVLKEMGRSFGAAFVCCAISTIAILF